MTILEQRLVKTMRTTRVTSIEPPAPDVILSLSERELLAEVATRIGETSELRRAGFTPAQIARLQFLKWSSARRNVEES